MAVTAHTHPLLLRLSSTPLSIHPDLLLMSRKTHADSLGTLPSPLLDSVRGQPAADKSYTFRKNEEEWGCVIGFQESRAQLRENKHNQVAAEGAASSLKMVQESPWPTSGFPGVPVATRVGS